MLNEFVLNISKWIWIRICICIVIELIVINKITQFVASAVQLREIEEPISITVSVSPLTYLENQKPIRISWSKIDVYSRMQNFWSIQIQIQIQIRHTISIWVELLLNIDETYSINPAKVFSAIFFVFFFSHFDSFTSMIMDTN